MVDFFTNQMTRKILISESKICLTCKQMVIFLRIKWKNVAKCPVLQSSRRFNRLRLCNSEWEAKEKVVQKRKRKGQGKPLDGNPLGSFWEAQGEEPDLRFARRHATPPGKKSRQKSRQIASACELGITHNSFWHFCLFQACVLGKMSLWQILQPWCAVRWDALRSMAQEQCMKLIGCKISPRLWLRWKKCNGPFQYCAIL